MNIRNSAEVRPKDYYKIQTKIQKQKHSSGIENRSQLHGGGARHHVVHVLNLNLFRNLNFSDLSFKVFKSSKVEVLGIMLFTFYGGSDSSWAPSYDTHAYFRSAIVLYSCSLCFSPQKLLSFSLRKQNHRDTFLNLLNKKKLA